jgi:hypothetical protein
MCAASTYFRPEERCYRFNSSLSLGYWSSTTHLNKELQIMSAMDFNEELQVREAGKLFPRVI